MALLFACRAKVHAFATGRRENLSRSIPDQDSRAPRGTAPGPRNPAPPLRLSERPTSRHRMLQCGWLHRPAYGDKALPEIGVTVMLISGWISENRRAISARASALSGDDHTVSVTLEADAPAPLARTGKAVPVVPSAMTAAAVFRKLRRESSIPRMPDVIACIPPELIPNYNQPSPVGDGAVVMPIPHQMLGLKRMFSRLLLVDFDAKTGTLGR